MPYDRTTDENDLAERIAALLLLLSRDVESGVAVDYAAFSQRLAGEIQTGLVPSFTAAANRLAVDHLGGELMQAERAAAIYAQSASVIAAAGIAEKTITGMADAVARQGNPSALFSRQRAGTIAITEITRAISAGRAFGAQQITSVAGGTMRRVWRKADNDACPVCSALNGTSPGFSPPAHPSCRCDEIYTFSAVPAGLTGGAV